MLTNQSHVLGTSDTHETSLAFKTIIRSNKKQSK